MAQEVFVVPLKRFDVAKERLRRGGVENVTGLASDLAAAVIESCAPRQVIVLSESSDVTRFALELGVDVLESEATSLNEAVQGAYERLRERFDRIIVVHGDLRDPRGLGEFEPDAGVTIVTDHLVARHQRAGGADGSRTFTFATATTRAEHHRVEAERLGVACAMVTDSPWRFDVDEPSDVTSP